MQFKMPHLILYYLIAILIISSFTNYFYINILNVGFCSIEILMIPILFIYRNHLKTIKSKGVINIFLLGILLTSLALLFLNNEQILTIANPIRSYCLFCLGFLIFRYSRFTIWNNIYSILLISVVADIVGSILTINLKINISTETMSMINILIPPYLISYSSRKKSNIEFILISILCIISAVLSITRGNILYVFFIILATLAFTKNKTKQLKYFIGIMVLLISGYYIYIISETLIEDFSPSMHYRLYTKILEYESVNTGDNIRKEHLLYLIDNISDCIVPHGFATRATDLVSFKNERLLWSIKDCSINELIYMFGFIGYLIPLYLIKIAYYLYKNKNSDIHFVFMICVGTIIMYLFSGYGLLIFPPTVLTLGCVIGSVYKLYKDKL